MKRISSPFIYPTFTGQTPPLRRRCKSLSTSKVAQRSAIERKNPGQDPCNLTKGAPVIGSATRIWACDSKDKNSGWCAGGHVITLCFAPALYGNEGSIGANIRLFHSTNNRASSSLSQLCRRKTPFRLALHFVVVYRK